MPDPTTISPHPPRPRPLRVLVVDDEANIRMTLGLCLEASGHEITSCANAHQAIQTVTAHAFDLIFLDVRLGVSNGLDLIPAMLAHCPWAKVIVITAYASAETAMIAMDRGAADYLPKPFTPAQVQLVVRKVDQQRKLELKLGALQVGERSDWADFQPLTTSSEMRQAVDLARRLATGDTTLLIRGEPGSGKERLARAIHAWSHRDGGACTAVSCQTTSADSLNAILFGTAPIGAPSIATINRGAAGLCDGGTLILKEIGAIPMTIQPRLVRLLRDKEYERHDDFVLRKSDVRVIATTSEDLDRSAARDRLRSDLLLAVNIVQIELPPLRQRLEDIRLLADHFRDAAARASHRTIGGFTDDAMDVLLTHPWPGNVRELRGVVERAVSLCGSSRIDLEHLPPTMLCRGESALENLMPLDALEEMHIRRVLATAKSLEAAAAILGIDPATLWRRRKQYGLD
ncbi:MAG TPA: sigma-54 dependent transcriptional regulator [Tepidisphaeraceae bacterium]|nr:sigma-54 dependent transcriptional regulator [Tepidisphaeraceae bacterium]